jgi:hypothetical protein
MSQQNAPLPSNQRSQGRASSTSVRASAGRARWARSLATAGAWSLVFGRDVGRLPLNLLRDLPRRALRLGATLLGGATGVAQTVPEAIWLLGARDPVRSRIWIKQRSVDAGYWLLGLSTRLFDLAGGPELGELLLHAATRTSPLTPTERAAVQAVLGPRAARWSEVRVSQAGLLQLIFRGNGGRAFATFHTINMPLAGYAAREALEYVVHELTHVMQYERAGSIYMMEALRAQASEESYDYGDLAGLDERRARSQHLRDLNREQQAALAQNYFQQCVLGAIQTAEPTLAELRRRYEPWIQELRAGRV